MGSEQFGPFAIEPAWRRRGPAATPFGEAEPPAEHPQSAIPVPVRVVATPVARAEAVPFGDGTPSEDLTPEDWPSGDSAPETLTPERWPSNGVMARAEFPVAGDVEIVALARVNPPPPEDKPAPSPFKPDPVLPQRPARTAARRRRRGLRVEGVIPYLAALVGLIALGGAIWLDRQNQERFAAISDELAAIRGGVQNALVAAQAAPVADPAPVAEGTVEALLALQTRIAALEDTARAAPDPGEDPIATGSVPEAGTSAGPLKTKLADGPTKDCIPLGAQFVMSVGEAYPICRTPEVIKVVDVNMEGVVLAGGKAVMAGATTALKFGDCSLAVLSTDLNGFAELEANCH